MESKTKIVATLGPASAAPEVLERMILAGVDVVRLNLSHGELAEHVARLHLVREVAERVGATVAVLADLPGPKVRTGALPAAGVRLVEGAVVELRPGVGPSTERELVVDYPSLLTDLHPGDRVALGDGAITVRVETVDTARVHARVLTGGPMQGRPGVHLPSERLRLHTPTEEDLRLAAAMVAEGVDFLAVSFVRAAADLRRVRESIAPRSARLVAKIETLPAVTALDEIVTEADAVMVARGDLGIECPLEDVPHLQKRIVRRCVELGVPVITATQMLESMITSPSPTRAEVSDVANAVFDGTDAVMLSAETAIGADPVAVVAAMARITGRAEREAAYAAWGDRLGRMQSERGASPWAGSDRITPDRITMAITHAAAQAAIECDAVAILCCTTSGRTARAMARFRPTPLLIGLSPDPATVRALALSWGVVPMRVEHRASTDDMVWFAVETAVREQLVRSGETVLVLAGASGRRPNTAADVLRIVEVR